MPAATGSFTATGNGATIVPKTDGRGDQPKGVNVAIWGTFVATVVLERSFDLGTTWVQANFQDTATAVSLTAAGCGVFYEPEAGVMWRLRCSAFTSGTANYRISFS